MTRDEARKYVQRDYTVKGLRDHLRENGVEFSARASKAELIEQVLDFEESQDN